MDDDEDEGETKIRKSLAESARPGNILNELVDTKSISGTCRRLIGVGISERTAAKKRLNRTSRSGVSADAEGRVRSGYASLPLPTQPST